MRSEAHVGSSDGSHSQQSRGVSSGRPGTMAGGAEPSKAKTLPVFF